MEGYGFKVFRSTGYGRAPRTFRHWRIFAGVLVWNIVLLSVWAFAIVAGALGAWRLLG